MNGKPNKVTAEVVRDEKNGVFRAITTWVDDQDRERCIECAQLPTLHDAAYEAELAARLHVASVEGIERKGYDFEDIDEGLRKSNGWSAKKGGGSAPPSVTSR